jgi:hypothetical protein
VPRKKARRLSCRAIKDSPGAIEQEGHSDSPNW